MGLRDLFVECRCVHIYKYTTFQKSFTTYIYRSIGYLCYTEKWYARKLHSIYSYPYIHNRVVEKKYTSTRKSIDRWRYRYTSNCHLLQISCLLEQGRGPRAASRSPLYAHVSIYRFQCVKIRSLITSLCLHCEKIENETDERSWQFADLVNFVEAKPFHSEELTRVHTYVSAFQAIHPRRAYVHYPRGKGWIFCEKKKWTTARFVRN